MRYVKVGNTITGTDLLIDGGVIASIRTGQPIIPRIRSMNSCTAGGNT